MLIIGAHRPLIRGTQIDDAASFVEGCRVQQPGSQVVVRR